MLDSITVGQPSPETTTHRVERPKFPQEFATETTNFNTDRLEVFGSSTFGKRLQLRRDRRRALALCRRIPLSQLTVLTGCQLSPDSTRTLPRRSRASSGDGRSTNFVRLKTPPTVDAKSIDDDPFQIRYREPKNDAPHIAWPTQELVPRQANATVNEDSLPEPQVTRSMACLKGVVAVGRSLGRKTRGGRVSRREPMRRRAKPRIGFRASCLICVKVGREPGQFQPYNFTHRKIGV